MTNKEAIYIINNRLNTYYCTDEDLQALDLAVKALEERPQGKWLFNTTFWNCSVCKKPAKTIGYCGDEKFMNEFFKFCPNCGAIMKGGAE